MPDGVLINGKGPYQYNRTMIPDGIDYRTFDVQPGIVNSITCILFSNMFLSG